MIDLRLAIDLHREKGIGITRQGLPQGRRGLLEECHEVESFELAATMKELTGRNVAIYDPACRVGQHHDQRGRLDHSVQQQFALMKVEALAAKQIAERVVGSDEVP